MSLKIQRRIAGSVLKCSPNRIVFDSERLGDVEEAITKVDVRGLIRDGIIQKKPETGISRGRARAVAEKKKHGQRRGQGSRKGTRSARFDKKKEWINRIRSQRKLLVRLREQKKVDNKVFRMLYMKAKGGFFRNVRHIQLYLDEYGLVKR